MNAPSKSSSRPRFPELSVAGAPYEMGEAIGEACRADIRELCALVVERFNRGNRAGKLTAADAEKRAMAALQITERHAPDMIDELRGAAAGAGVTFSELFVLNARNMLARADDERPAGLPIKSNNLSRRAASEANEGCTSVMVSAPGSVTGDPIAGQNWDNDPEMDRFSLVLTRKPTGKPSIITWTQPGLIAYIGMNSAGLGVLMNALNGPSRRSGVPWYFIVRNIYEQHSLADVVRTVESTPRAISANAAMVTPDGAADLEVTPDAVRVIRPASEHFLAHTNHCVNADLDRHNAEYPHRIFGQSFERKRRAEALMTNNAMPASVSSLAGILSDHQGFPTAICRHPNADPSTGWQRSVVSIILEPAAGRMHVSRGNPCESPYETYVMN